MNQQNKNIIMTLHIFDAMSNNTITHSEALDALKFREENGFYPEWLVKRESKYSAVINNKNK